MKKALYFLIPALILLCIVVIVPQLTKRNINTITGRIVNVTAGGANDLIFLIDNNKTSYYINRGLEHGFELNKAKKDFKGKKATLFYTNSWTLLAPFGTNGKNITRIIINDSVIYSE